MDAENDNTTSAVPMTQRSYFELHPVLTVASLVSLSLFSIIGTCGNILVIGAVLTDRRLRKESNILVFNLALADICVTGVVNPFHIVTILTGPDFFLQRPALCHLIGCICLVGCICSLWTITAISVNRYTLLCKRHFYRKIFTKRKTFVIAIFLWVYSFLIDSPNFYNWGDHVYDTKTMSCIYDRLASYSYTVFFITTCVTVPLITVLFCNINIFVEFTKSKRRVHSHGETVVDETGNDSFATETAIEEMGPRSESVGRPSKQTSVFMVTQNFDTNSPTQLENQSAAISAKPQQTATKQKRKMRHKFYANKEFKLAKTLFVIFIVFVICWAPYAVFCLVDFADDLPRPAYAISIQMAHISSSINSILYAAMNTSFRDGYIVFIKKIWPCLK